jgi:cytochrome c553
MKRALLGISLSALAVAVVVPACSADPHLSDAISALGNEKGAVNENHRAGQPCLLCHQKGGAADTDFSVAGTVFASPGTLVGVEGARIELVDANKTSPPVDKPVVTNCVGNFFVKRSDWDPAFPIAVRVSKGSLSRTMRSSIGRAGSCADCHKAEIPLKNPFGSVPQVFLFGDDGDPAGKSKNCDRDPDLSRQ